MGSVRILRVLLISAVLIFVTLEIALRFMVLSSVDGQRYYGMRFMEPRQLPVQEVTNTLERYQNNSESRLIYDSLTGWTNRPNHAEHNAAGMRTEREYAPNAAELLRVATFGDSFTYGVDVEQQESWPYVLQMNSPEAEILNFGVAGYGLDQAYLRWQQQTFEADMVVLGFVHVDVPRLLNIIWKLHSPLSDIPFTKPRFILNNGELELINSPTVPPAEIPEFIRTFPSSALVQYEYFYDPAEYQQQWWSGSYGLAVLDTLWRGSREPGAGNAAYVPDEIYDLDGEAGLITLAILDHWAQAVEAQGSEFVIIHLPLLRDVTAFQSGEPLLYQALLDAIRSRYTVIETLDRFDAALPTADYYSEAGHYSPLGNQVIAQVMAEYLANQE